MLLGLYKGVWGHYRTGVQKSSALLLLANQRLGRGNRIAFYVHIVHKHRKAKICLSWCLIKVLNDDMGEKNHIPWFCSVHSNLLLLREINTGSQIGVRNKHCESLSHSRWEIGYVKCRVSCWQHVQVAIPCGSPLWKVNLEEKWVYKRGLKGTTHIFSPPEVTAPVHLAIRVCLCLFIRKRILHGCGYEQADLLKSEITWIKIWPILLGKKRLLLSFVISWPCLWSQEGCSRLS